MEPKTRIKSFTDLYAWQEAHKLGLSIYKETKKFPSSELFSLTNQIQRASISITSNIAEGFSRNSNKDKIQFYYIALGSLSEVQSQLLLAKDLGYIPNQNFQDISIQTIIVSKLLNGLIKSLQSHP